VRPDVDLEYTVAELVDGTCFAVRMWGGLEFFIGAFFNSGQSCCAVEVRYDHYFLVSI
jgi:hypothetical protein